MKKALMIVGMLLTASVAQATRARHIPDPIVIATSDLVIVGKITACDADAVDRQNPLAPAGPKIPMRACKVVVSEVIFDRQSSQAPDAKREPQRPQAGDVLTVAWPRPHLKGDFEPSIGTEYALVLKRTPDGNDWYVSMHPAYTRQATPEVVAALKNAAKLDIWGWGEPTDGLRLGLMVEEILPYRAKEGQAVPVMIAVRNTSQQTVYLNCKPEDELLSARGVAADGNTVTVPLRRAEWATGTDKENFRKLEPGQMSVITPNGARDDDYTFHLPLPPGKAKLQVIYESKREGYVHLNPDDKGGPDLWKGKLSSAAVDIELPMPIAWGAVTNELQAGLVPLGAVKGWEGGLCPNDANGTKQQPTSQATAVRGGCCVLCGAPKPWSATFIEGEPMRMELHVRNLGKEERNLCNAGVRTFPQICREWQFTFTPVGGGTSWTAVWAVMPFVPPEADLKLGVGYRNEATLEQHLGGGHWIFSDRQGRHMSSLPAGKYTLTASYAHSEHEPAKAPNPLSPGAAAEIAARQTARPGGEAPVAKPCPYWHGTVTTGPVEIEIKAVERETGSQRKAGQEAEPKTQIERKPQIDRERELKERAIRERGR